MILLGIASRVGGHSSSKGGRTYWHTDMPWANQVDVLVERDRKAYRERQGKDKSYNTIPISDILRFTKRWRNR